MAIIQYQRECGYEAAIGMLEVMKAALIKDVQETVDAIAKEKLKPVEQPPC
jgi:hypothetical protein